MDLRLLKALAKNWILIVRKITEIETESTDSPKLLEYCPNRSFQDTENLIYRTDKPNGEATDCRLFATNSRTIKQK